MSWQQLWSVFQIQGFKFTANIVSDGWHHKTEPCTFQDPFCFHKECSIAGYLVISYNGFLLFSLQPAPSLGMELNYTLNTLH